MKYKSITDTGKVRKQNEDSYINYKCDDYLLCIVADGMGGHNAGEVASSLAVKYTKEYIVKNFNKYNNDIEKLLLDSVIYSNNKVLELSKEKEEYVGMGTTIIISLFVEDILYFLNIGDSRIYIFTNNVLKQITKDHSYVQFLIDSKAITEEEAKFYPRNQITSALGTKDDFSVDIKSMKLCNGDVILMVTDGLTDLIEDNEIYDVLVNRYSLLDTVEMLVYMANSTGGKDNITITCIKVD